MLPFRKKIQFPLSEQEYRQRIQLQSKKTLFKVATNRIFIENFSFLFSLFKSILGWTKWYEKGKQNALKVQVRNEIFHFPNLPQAFHNLKILHLSDLHLNHQPELAAILAEKTAKLDFDICLITGDIHHKNTDDFLPTIELLKIITPSLLKAKHGVWAVLGNHDFIDMVIEMKKIGIQTLINQTISLEKDEQTIYLTGMDELILRNKKQIEPNFFQHAKQNFHILATHTPELITLAASNFSLYLCGHTHGGQICLPTGKPLILNTGAPLIFCKGKWKFLNMQGYTSVGAGTSGLPVRFHCPPEMTIHTLKRN